MSPNRPRTHEAKIEEAAKKRHERLVEQWRNIRRLYFARADLRDICRQLGISARTVYRYKDLLEPPPRRAYKKGTPKQRGDLRALHGAAPRCAEAQGRALSSVPRARQGCVAGLSPTAKNVAALFMRRKEKLSEEQEEYLKRLSDADEALADARRLTQEFAGMVRGLEYEARCGRHTPPASKPSATRTPRERRE